jgi:SAM-dependent methyltransferase
MADVVDVLDDEEATTPTRMDVYDRLAVVYDFVNTRRRDYGSTATFVDEHAPSGATTIGVGACGTGLLLPHLEGEYDTVVGFDSSSSMLERARARTDVELVVADLRTCVADRRFDVFTILGQSLAHLVPDHSESECLSTVLAKAYESLRPGGVLVCDFIGSASVRDGDVIEQVTESDRYRVTETVVTTVTDADLHGLGPAGNYTYAFEVLDRERSIRVQTSASAPVRGLEPVRLLEEVLAAGFTEVALVEPTRAEGLVARRPE